MRKSFDSETLLYLVCFNESLGDSNKSRGTAKHYLGSCKKGRLRARIAEHITLKKVGASIMRAVVLNGSGGNIFVLSEKNGRALESYYKRRKKSFSKICPGCSGQWSNNLNPYS